MSQPIPFFATRSDILSLLEDVEATQPLRYVLAGMFDEPVVLQWERASEVPELGTATSGDPTLDRAFLVLPSERLPVLREVPQRRGGTRYAVDLRQNRPAAGLRPGGWFEGDTLIAGQLGASRDESPVSGRLAKLIRGSFKRVKSFHVGPEAFSALREGARLTTHYGGSPEYDLTM